MRTLAVSLAFAAAASSATLEKLNLTEMAAKSTEVVRAKVGACSPAYRGKVIYTTCVLEVGERWKGIERSSVAVAVPGGKIGNIRQSFSGAPSLVTGKEHVFFLWTGPSGLTQIIGLSQGLLDIERTASGELMAVRTPSANQMLDAAGNAVRDEGVDVPIADLRKQVTQGAGR